MPEVFTDEHAHASETSVEGTDVISPSKEATFVEKTIGGEVDFVMDMEDLPLGKIGGGDVEAMTMVFVYEADHDVDVLGLVEELFEDGVLRGGLEGDGGGDVLEEIAGEGELGEDDEVSALLTGTVDVV